MDKNALSLVIGTHNKKKGKELVELLGPRGFDVVTLSEIDTAIEVVEDGDTFAANARLKACQQAEHLGKWVLADDSGIVVDALDGRPGVFSARYAGPQASDDDNNRKLLEELADVAPPKRTAHYVAHITLSDPAGNVRAEADGTCHGVLRTELSGSGGFGYDPLFEVREYHRTFGELGPAVKRAISHRSRALRKILPHLVRLTPDWHKVG